MITKVKTAGRDEWLALRSKYIGGSDAAAVVGLNPWVSPYSLWAEKTGKLPCFSGNLATEVGTYLEEFISKKFEAETGKKLRRVNQSFFNSEYPWAIANIDRDVIGEDAGVEMKSTDSLNIKKFKNGEYPAHYYCQCVHYMAVTGKKRWYLAVLIGNREFKRFVIERDEEEIAALMAAEEDFFKHVQNNTPPGIDGTQATTIAIKAIYSDNVEKMIDLFGFSEQVDQYIKWGKKIDELKVMREEAANRIKEYMGEADGGECDRYHVSWKPSIRRLFDIKRFTAENPDIDLSEYYNESSTRIFRVSEIK